MTNMNTPDEILATTPMPCGCQVDRESDEIVSHCARHACHAVMRFAEVDARRCPFCASLNTTLSPAGIHMGCGECGCRFETRKEQ